MLIKSGAVPEESATAPVDGKLRKGPRECRSALQEALEESKNSKDSNLIYLAVMRIIRNVMGIEEEIRKAKEMKAPNQNLSEVQELEQFQLQLYVSSSSSSPS